MACSLLFWFHDASRARKRTLLPPYCIRMPRILTVYNSVSTGDELWLLTGVIMTVGGVGACAIWGRLTMDCAALSAAALMSCDSMPVPAAEPGEPGFTYLTGFGSV